MWRSTNPDDIDAASRFLASHRMLDDLLRAGAEVLDVVIQDEYTHDVVARLPGGLIAVFDST